MDWLTFTFPKMYLPLVRLELDARLGPSTEGGGGFEWFRDGCCRWATKAGLAWNDQTRRCMLQLNGDTLATLGAETAFQIHRFLANDCSAKLTRLDVALDVQDKRITLDMVQEAAEAGNVVRFRRVDVRKPIRLTRAGIVKEGHGVYLGLRGKDGSGRFVRWYDKGLETKGEYDVTRCEVEFTGEVAEVLGGDLGDCQDLPTYLRRCGRALTRAMDFRRRGSHREIDRMPRLAFWAQVVDCLDEGLSDAAGPRPKLPLARKLEWVRRAVAPTLALARTVMESAGQDWLAFLSALVDDGESRIPWDGLSAVHLGFDPDLILRPRRPSLSGVGNVGFSP